MIERFLNMLLEKAHGIALKWHMAIGFSFGSFFAFLKDHYENILEGALVGLAGAISASLWKMLVDWIFKRKKQCKDEKKI